MIVDLEPFLVLVLGLRYPLHGYLHTLLLASLLGLSLGYIMFVLERFLRQLYRAFLLEPGKSLSLTSFMLAGALGAMLHVLMDSPLYDDIRPLYPLAANPLFNPDLTSMIYDISLWMGLLGAMYYLYLLASTGFKALKRRADASTGTSLQGCEEPHGKGAEKRPEKGSA